MENNIFDYCLPFRGSAYNPCEGRWYAEGYSPCVGVYLWREIADFHGDIELFPKWQRLTLPQYFQAYREAVAANKRYQTVVEAYWEECAAEEAWGNA